MRKYIVAVLLLAHLTISKASEREVQNDSILREGKTLYKYEKATWLVSDLAYKSSIKNEIRHSLTYAQNDTIVVIYTDKDKQLIYEGKMDASVAQFGIEKAVSRAQLKVGIGAMHRRYVMTAKYFYLSRVEPQ